MLLNAFFEECLSCLGAQQFMLFDNLYITERRDLREHFINIHVICYVGATFAYIYAYLLRESILPTIASAWATDSWMSFGP